MPQPSRTSLSRRTFLGLGTGAAALALTGYGQPAQAGTALLNVSYDPSRELYRKINPAFTADQKQKNPASHVIVRTSNGASGAQARSVLEGAPADVVTLGLSRDVDILAKNGLIAADWQKRLPHNSTPFTSTIVLLVRRGNPKGIRGWQDLTRPDITIITPNPRTSGGARWNYLAAWGWALRHYNGSEADAAAYMKAFYARVPVFDTAARGAMNNFVQRSSGDVLVAWENEALLAVHDLAPGQFEIVIPERTIVAEPPAAMVDRNVKAHGTETTALAYLNFLYGHEAQVIGGAHYFRPTETAAARQFRDQFPEVNTFSIADLGGWKNIQKRHFSDGGLFDQISIAAG